MDINNVNSAIDYCKGRIKSYKAALEKNRTVASKNDGYDKIAHAKINKKLRHYTIMLEALNRMLLEEDSKHD